MPVPLIAAALSAIAPELARQGLDLLSGIFRGAVTAGTEKVADLIEQKTGIDINDVANNKLTEAQWGKLKDFELQHQEQLLALRQQAAANELERDRLDQGDRADARGLQKAALASDDRLARRFIYYYAVTLTIFTFWFISYAAFFHHPQPPDPNSERIINTVVGFLLGMSLSPIVQYFFGSSLGSKSKEAQIARLAAPIEFADARVTRL